MTLGPGSSAGETWNSLTPSEKLLVVLYPSDAIVVKACQEATDEYTNQYYYGWTDGDEENAFRHALWNAMMTAAIGRTQAENFATAHEAWPEEDLRNAEPWNGFDAFQHKAMDLHNNQKGRDCVKWYEIFITDNTLITRVLEKINNGEMVILVD